MWKMPQQPKTLQDNTFESSIHHLHPPPPAISLSIALTHKVLWSQLKGETATSFFSFLFVVFFFCIENALKRNVRRLAVVIKMGILSKAMKTSTVAAVVVIKLP